MTQLMRRQHERANSPLQSNFLNMERSIRRMEVLVNDLLGTSLMETGMFALHKSPCDLVALCHHIHDEYVMGANFSLALDLPTTPVEVVVDVNRISQVVINLLSNARKYSPKDAPITLTLQQTEHEGIISVRDQGVGIPSDQLPHLFNRFFRVPTVEVQTGSSVGLGLGLYIARKIVERHGGRIEVESTPQEGSLFSVALPLAVAVPQPEEQSQVM
jgi:signal transduction histidine kinase